ncbi:MAG: CapA family protein [Acidobacteria bacterium]|nr:CapA family protein [Acidobacteriota bacterium]
MRTRLLLSLLILAAATTGAQQTSAPSAQDKYQWDQSKSVYNRRLKSPEPPEQVDWDGRIALMLKEDPDDVILTAVGDMIFNEKISDLPEPDHQNLYRLMREADIAFGNLEMSLNERPDLQRPFYNFRMGRDFAWEIANIGINLVGMANNHSMDYGPEGVAECLTILDHSGIKHAGAGTTLAEAHSPAIKKVQNQKSKFALLSYMRFWTPKKTSNPNGPSLATIDPGEILVRSGDKVEAVEGPLKGDVEAMEDDVVLAKRHSNFVMVSLHVHDLSHDRSFGYPDVTPPNDTIEYRSAIDAGADVVFGNGPHVLRGIEIYKGKPIFYSLGNFIYQYRTPDKIPIDLVHQRDPEVERPTNVSVYDRRDSRQEMESILVRMTVNKDKLKKIQLIPVTLDDEGRQYGAPRLASAKRAKEIIALIQKLSAPYKTKIIDEGWYAEVEL